MAADRTSFVSARGLTRRFGGRVAIEGVSLDLWPGEVLALLGPNGAGKTTTMRLLAGLIGPDEGTVEVDGVPLTTRAGPAVRRRLGLLTEAPGLWDRLSVEANLLTYARLYELDDPARRVRESLARFDLLDRRADFAATLSKGMKQKVAIARALLHDPGAVLLDEPTAGLDPAMARSVRELVLELRDEGRAILISTHNLDEAERVADRVAVLKQHLIAVESPETLRRRLFGTHVRIDVVGPASPWADTVRAALPVEVDADGSTLRCRIEHADEHIPAIVRALVQAGAPVRGVVEERAGLEDVYLALVEPGSPAGNANASTSSH
jgi:ABC-2 type transport system ATP-binding protein